MEIPVCEKCGETIDEQEGVLCSDCKDEKWSIDEPNVVEYFRVENTITGDEYTLTLMYDSNTGTSDYEIKETGDAPLDDDIEKEIIEAHNRGV